MGTSSEIKTKPLVCKIMTTEQINALFLKQLALWDLAKKNYKALETVQEKQFTINGNCYKVQFNPARIVSSAAKVDAKSIQERKCFLCRQNLSSEQIGLPFEANYQILVNPFPIFPRHLTVPDQQHTDQRIAGRFKDMLSLAEAATDYIIFYNGPRCGASAPDHMHFQAGNKGFLPLENDWKKQKAEKIGQGTESTLWALNDEPRNTLVIESTNKDEATKLFDKIYQVLEANSRNHAEEEPMMNLITWKEGKRFVTCLFPRVLHRPSCYHAEGDQNILISPASVDMGGVFITPLEKDFKKITAEDLTNILKEVCLQSDDFATLKTQLKAQL